MVVNPDETGHCLCDQSHDKLATKNPRFTAKLGQEVLEYLAGTKEVGLKYGPVESGDFGPEGCFALSKKHEESGGVR